MNFVKYDHLGGDKAVSAPIQSEVEQAISGVAVKPAKGVAEKIRDAVIKGISAHGWTGEMPVAQGSKISVTSTKSDIGLCLQTGNMSRIYADLLKLQTMYLKSAIKAAVIIVPSDPVAKKIGSNIANAKRLERELPIFSRAYSVPTLVYSLEF